MKAIIYRRFLAINISTLKNYQNACTRYCKVQVKNRIESTTNPKRRKVENPFSSDTVASQLEYIRKIKNRETTKEQIIYFDYINYPCKEVAVAKEVIQVEPGTPPEEKIILFYSAHVKESPDEIIVVDDEGASSPVTLEDPKRFQFECKIGEGSYGEVYKAKDLVSQQLVAMKKIKREFSYVDMTSCERELAALKQLKHKNIVSLIDVIHQKEYDEECDEEQVFMYIILEYMGHDLMWILQESAVMFNEESKASIMRQILEGVAHCHKNGFLHRDIKTSNILINSKGVVKLADFGLARIHNNAFEKNRRPYTSKVVTYWYRAPELFYGDAFYGTAIDMWSCGCVLGELFFSRPIFRGHSESEQLDRIFKTCGSLTPEVWPGVKDLPLYNFFKPTTYYRRNLQNEFWYMPKDARDILDRMLMLNPSKRISAQEALESSWLSNIIPEQIKFPVLPTWHNENQPPRRAHFSYIT